MAVRIDRLDGLRLEEGRDRFFGLGRTTLPIVLAQSVTSGREADLKGVGILDDQPLEPFGATVENAEAHRTAVVLHVEAEAFEARIPVLRAVDRFPRGDWRSRMVLTIRRG